MAFFIGDLKMDIDINIFFCEQCNGYFGDDFEKYFGKIFHSKRLCKECAVVSKGQFCEY